MCEMLIRVHDQTSEDPVQDSKLTKRGDVIVVVPDGWRWGLRELDHPFWRILRVPGLGVEVASQFLGRERSEDPAGSRMLRQRAFGLDVDHPSLPAEMRAWLADDSRAVPAHTTTLTPAAVMALKVRKAPLEDPAVIGGPANVIG